LISAAVILSGSASCSQKETTPVATASFSSNKARAALRSPVEFTYRFDVAPDAVIKGDYRVLVHVVSDDGRLMWTDDHDPPVPTSQWKPGQKIEYTRTRFVPGYQYLGTATVRVGLYRGDDRLPLAGTDAARREYKVGSIEIRPQSESILLIEKSGWHQVEFAPNDPTSSWQWIQKSAVLNFKNPHQDVVFYLDTEGRPDLLDKPQTITIWSGTEKVSSFVVDTRLTVIRTMPITAAQLGTAEMAEIRIEADRSFVPAQIPGSGDRDARELGLRIYHAFVEVK
jgi:hypothetical protein